MKRIFLFLSGLAFGVLVGFISFRYPNPIKSELTNASFTEHSLEKVQSIKQLSSKEEQIAAAEAYYGKAVILFLATLAHKNEVNQKDTLEAQTFNKVATAPSDTKTDTGMPTAETIPPVGRLTHKDSLDQKQKNDELIKQERMINFQIAKPFTEFTPQVKAINGLFEGTFTIQSGKNKGRVDFIEFEVDLRQEKKKLSGSILCKITDPDGFTYSNSLNTGANAKLKPIKDKGNEIYMEPAPGSFIILDISNSNLLRGEFYDKDGGYKGQVQLSRKNG